MANKFAICIVDDQLPLVGEVDDSHLISSNYLVKSISPKVNWGEEKNLQYLTILLLKSDLFKKEEIDIKWARNPNILINAINLENYFPGVIIYDWEYGLSYMKPEDV